MATFDDILKTITGAVERFNQQIPAAQKTMLQAIQEDLRALDLSGGNVKATVKNLSIIARIKGKMNKVLLTDKYKGEVKEYVKAFNEVTQLQNQYWTAVESEFKPRPLLKAIQKMSIEDTVQKLTEAGIGANIGDKIGDILRTSITSGGSYAALNDQLRESLTTTPGGIGAVEKYTKQITTDALNQYNAQYTQTVSSDLGYEWFKYDNTDIETTRPFCDAMTDVKFFHISEVPAILKAQGLTYVNKKGERVQVPIYAKTGLPHGMIPGTDASTFFINRGGYNCGHQIRPVPAAQVPDDIKSRVMATPAYIRWAAQQRADGKAENIPEAPKTPPPPAVTLPPENIQQVLLKKNKIPIQKMKDSGINPHEDLLQYLPKSNVKMFYSARKVGSYFDPETKELHINAERRLQNKEWRDKVVAHEIGHAIHFENEILTFKKVSPGFEKFRNELLGVIRGNTGKISLHLDEMRDKAQQGDTSINTEDLTVIADILGGLTKGSFGFGHQPSYYASMNRGDMEIFAHAVAFTKTTNVYENLTPEIKEIVDKMRTYMSDTLESIKLKS